MTEKPDREYNIMPDNFPRTELLHNNNNQNKASTTQQNTQSIPTTKAQATKMKQKPQANPQQLLLVPPW